MDRLRILIVDDEEDLVSTLAERLALRGFQVEAVTNGADALTLLGENGVQVLIVDVKMPGIDGLELTSEIKRRHPDLPVILFSGYSSLADAQRATKEGAFDYLVKPIDIDELIQKISKAAGAKAGPES